jgi:Tetracyclin repressor-like, C-terminal domain
VYNDVSARDASPRRIGEPGGRTSRRRLPFRRSSGRLRLALGCGLTWSTLPSHGWAGRTARVRTAVLDAAVAELVEHGFAGLNRFWLMRAALVRPLVDQAVRRGQLPAGTDADEVIRHVGAPLYYRLLVLAEPLSGEAADLAAAVATTAAKAGVFVQSSQRTDRKSS